MTGQTHSAELAAAADTVAAARALWREKLAEIPDSAAFVAQQEQLQVDAGVQVHGKPIVGVAEPLFLTEAQRRRDQEVIHAVSQCLLAAGAAASSNDQLKATYLPGWGAEPLIAKLIDAEVGYSSPIVMGRFDTVLTPTGLKVMEFNGGLPGGLLAAALIPDYLKAWPIYQQVAEQFELSAPRALDLVLDGMTEVWQDFSGQELEWVAVVSPQELHPLVNATVVAMQIAASQRGVEVVLIEPADLEYTEGALRHQGRDVQLVLRAFFTPMFSSLGDRLAPLVQGLLDEKVCMISSVKSGMYGNKSLFALITDNTIDLELPSGVRELAQAHMPWTRMVSDIRSVDPHGNQVNLLDYIKEAQHSLVIKPAAGFGGFDVTLGWTTSAEKWLETITKAVGTGGYIVQDRLNMVPQQFAQLQPGFPVAEVIADYNPIVLNQDIAAYFVRQTVTGGLTNISSGDGAIIPVINVAELPAQH